MKHIAKTITFKEFNKRFRKDSNNQGYKDNLTGLVIYCPHDLGFEFNQSDCLQSSCCKDCWNEVNDYLKFKER